MADNTAQAGWDYRGWLSVSGLAWLGVSGEHGEIPKYKCVYWFSRHPFACLSGQNLSPKDHEDTCPQVSVLSFHWSHYRSALLLKQRCLGPFQMLRYLHRDGKCDTEHLFA